MSGGQKSRYIDTFDRRAIDNAIQQIQDGPDFGDDLRSAIRELGDKPTREELKSFITQREDFGDSLLDAITRAKQKSILRKLEDKLYYIDDIGDVEIDEISASITLTDTAYYQSYFNFAGKSVTVCRTNEEGGIFSRISSEAESRQEAQELFRDYVSGSDISNLYIDANGEIPAPLIGRVDFSPKPRFVHFENKNHIYMEFWTKLGKNSYFDVNKGDYITVERRAKTAVRVHLDTGIIEFISTKDATSHRTGLVDKLIERFWMDDEMEPDGGVPTLVAGVANLHNRINIQDDHIAQIKENLGILSTLDGFRGGITNIRFSSRNNNDVGRDPDHQHIEDNRDLRLSHPNIVLGENNGELELISREQIEEIVSITPEMSVDEIIEEFAETSSYSNVHRYTIVLNSDNNTIRIWKENYSPRTRRKLIHLIENELGW